VITIRGKTVEPMPLTFTQLSQVIDSMRVVSRAGNMNLLGPAVRPHFLRIVAMSIKPYFPGATLDELAAELFESLAPDDLLTIVPIVFDATHYTHFHLQKDPGHG
jgi:hypothetical protein